MDTSLPPKRSIPVALLIVAFAFGICMLVAPNDLMTWVSLVVISAVPAQVIISLFWHCEWPLEPELSQPAKGIALVLLTLIIGALIGYLAMQTIGGGMTPPTPYVIMFLIPTVPLCLWMVILLQGWPFNRLSSSPVLTGVLIWLSAYVIELVLFYTLFNFEFLANTPLNNPSLDPAGPFTAWSIITVSVTFVMVMLCFVLLEFWPTTQLARLLPSIMHQPLFGLVNTLLVAIVSALCMFIAIHMAEMDMVQYFANLTVSAVFGIFIVLVLLHSLPALALNQPLRGILLIVIAFALGATGYWLYTGAARYFYQLPAGEPGYTLEVWLASAMLGVTFPTMVVAADYLAFWPFVSRPHQGEDSGTKTDGAET